MLYKQRNNRTIKTKFEVVPKRIFIVLVQNDCGIVLPSDFGDDFGGGSSTENRVLFKFMSNSRVHCSVRSCILLQQ